MSSARGTLISLCAGDPKPPEGALAVAGQLEVSVAGGVALAIAAGAVKLEAVELDGEPLLGPEGVDLVRGLLSFNCSIEGWSRECRGPS
jgi:hypothetical protein